MTEFKRLHNDQQVEIVWKFGEVVSSHVEGFYKYLLLQVYSFYVELRYDTRLDSMDFETHSVCSRNLEPYLNKINLDHLLVEAGLEHE